MNKKDIDPSELIDRVEKSNLRILATFESDAELEDGFDYLTYHDDILYRSSAKSGWLTVMKAEEYVRRNPDLDPAILEVYEANLHKWQCWDAYKEVKADPTKYLNNPYTTKDQPDSMTPEAQSRTVELAREHAIRFCDSDVILLTEMRTRLAANRAAFLTLCGDLDNKNRNDWIDESFMGVDAQISVTNLNPKAWNEVLENDLVHRAAMYCNMIEYYGYDDPKISNTMLKDVRGAIGEHVRAERDRMNSTGIAELYSHDLNAVRNVDATIDGSAMLRQGTTPAFREGLGEWREAWKLLVLTGERPVDARDKHLAGQRTTPGVCSDDTADLAERIIPQVVRCDAKPGWLAEKATALLQTYKEFCIKSGREDKLEADGSPKPRRAVKAETRGLEQERSISRGRGSR